MKTFRQRLEGALYGVAIGDAMGAPVEGWASKYILENFETHNFRRFLPVTHKGDPATGKGDGRITDDTLMTEALILAYNDARDHLDAYGYAQFLLPHVKDTRIWVPEYQRDMNLWDRLWFPEKYPWMRLRGAHIDPRSAGVGNCVNCGIAMWMMPAGAVNAGDPQAAYQEAAAIGLAHNESFAVEAGAVMAAAYAEAFSASTSIRKVLQVSCDIGRDGTRNACAAAVAAARPTDSFRRFVARVRAAVAPFDQREGHVSDDHPLQDAGVSDVGHPSRIASIEELPVALAALKYGNGDFIKTIRAGVFYGRDCDSIAGMAGGLHGAIYGAPAVPRELRTAADTANRRDLAALAGRFAATCETILARDRTRMARRVKSV